MNKQASPHPIHGKHWHYLYERRRKRARALGINAGQMAWSQVFSLIGSIIAGVLLESNKVTLGLIAGAFVVLPGIFDLDGSLGASLSAKINHQMEQPSVKAIRAFTNGVVSAMLIAASAGLVVALCGAGIATVFFDAVFMDVFLLAYGAIVLSGLIGFPLIGALSIFFRKKNMNPDDLVGPIESSVFDILTIITMVIVIGWLV